MAGEHALLCTRSARLDPRKSDVTQLGHAAAGQQHVAGLDCGTERRGCHVESSMAGWHLVRRLPCHDGCGTLRQSCSGTGAAVKASCKQASKQNCSLSMCAMLREWR